MSGALGPGVFFLVEISLRDVLASLLGAFIDSDPQLTPKGGGRVGPPSLNHKLASGTSLYIRPPKYNVGLTSLYLVGIHLFS